MPEESANGSDPSHNGTDPTLDGESDGRAPFERFEDLTKEILSVPKAELDKRRKKAKRPRSTSARS